MSGLLVNSTAENLIHTQLPQVMVFSKRYSLTCLHIVINSSFSSLASVKPTVCELHKDDFVLICLCVYVCILSCHGEFLSRDLSMEFWSCDKDVSLAFSRPLTLC